MCLRTGVAACLPTPHPLVRKGGRYGFLGGGVEGAGPKAQDDDGVLRPPRDLKEVQPGAAIPFAWLFRVKKEGWDPAIIPQNSSSEKKIVTKISKLARS